MEAIFLLRVKQSVVVSFVRLVLSMLRILPSVAIPVVR